MSGNALKSTKQALQFSMRVGLVTLMVAACVLLAFAKEKKKDTTKAATPKGYVMDEFDKSKIVWPAPPAITRVRYLDYWAGERMA